MRHPREHAVVLGAGVAGLLAARVLVDAYQRVTVVDRDPLPAAAGHRRGVPQDRHAHLLVPGGTEVLDKLFPGLLDELTAAGVPRIGDFAEFHFAPTSRRLHLRGRPADPFVHLASRPCLEGHLRARVRAQPGVVLVDRCDVAGLTTDATGARVTGVRVRHRDEGIEETLHASLVVDATGRGSRTPAWIAALGYDQLGQQRIPVDLVYATCHLRLHPGALDTAKVVAVGAVPDRPTGLVLFAQEGERWILTVFGYPGHHPARDRAGLLASVKTIAPPDVFAAIRDAEPLDDIVTYRFAANLRRRYDLVRRFPAGLLVFGDAICSTNPAFGLGMSAAALQALALQRTLAGGDRDLARRFFRAAAKPLGQVWQLTEGAEQALTPRTEALPLPARVLGSYVERVQSAAGHDPVVAARLLRVMSLQDPLSRLLRPSVALRALLPRPMDPAVR